MSDVLNQDSVKAMRQRFKDGISCAEIGRNATLWQELMDDYMARIKVWKAETNDELSAVEAMVLRMYKNPIHSEISDSDESWEASEALLRK